MAGEPKHARPLALVLGPPDVLCAQARPGYGKTRTGPQWCCTLVAEVDGVPAGVAAVSAPRWHAERLWVCVEVGECYRRRGIGSLLLRAARRRAGDDGRPLRGKVFAGSAGAGFAAAHGFTSIQRSRTFRLDGPTPRPPAGFGIATGAPPDEVAAAFRDFYVTSHAWDPAGSMTADDIRRTHVDEAVSTVLVRDAGGEVLAVGCLYDEEGDGGLLLSGGPTRPDDMHARAATAALLDTVPRPFLVEADDSVDALIAELEARGAEVLDEVHVVADY